jgi:hypothetical protein
LVVVSASAWILAAAAGADAAPLTIGQLPPSAPPASCSAGPFDVIQHGVSSGRDYVVPEGYTKISSWSTYGGTEVEGQSLEMKVFFHVSGTTYTQVAHDGPRTVKPGVVNTFPVDISIYPELVLGINDGDAAITHNACSFGTPSAEDLVGTLAGDLGDGYSGLFPFNGSHSRLNLTATLVAPPGVDVVEPGTGPSAGGTKVLIAGHDLSGASAVRFGSTPAASFNVISDSAITAISPAGEGLVDVTVTTIAGTTPPGSADRFTYESSAARPPSAGGRSCVVPRITGMTLKAARRALKKADCKLGKVKGRGRVRSENPKQGTVKPPGTRVGVTLAKPKH